MRKLLKEVSFMSTKNNIKIRYLVFTAVFSAISVVLMYLEISIPIVPSFIKFDFSDLPALICSFAFGPLYGVLVCLLKNLLHLFASQSAFIGELANFLMGSIFALAAGTFYKFHKTRGGAVMSSVIASFSMGILSLPINYFVIYPLYYKVLGLPQEAILGMYKALVPSVNSIFGALCLFNLPFTICKGLIVSLIAFFIYKPLSPLLKYGRKNKPAEV